MTVLIDPRPALRSILLVDAATRALQDERVYHLHLPQNPVVPCTSFFQVSGQGDHHNAGPSGLGIARWQFNAWGGNPDDAVTLGLAVKAALDGVKDAIGYGDNSPQDTVTFRGIFFDSEQDLYDDEAGLFYRAMDFRVWWAER